MNLSAVLPEESSRRELNEVFAKILLDVAPSELPMLKSIEHVTSDSATTGVASVSGAGRLRKRGLPGVMEAGLVSLHLVAGTLALIDLYLKRKERLEQREFEEDIRQEWQKALIQAGMSPELARYIPVKFSGDVIRFISMQRIIQTENTDKP